MKKSLIFAGMLAVGYANAQYEGKVGVNTETPKATLEVQPTATNLTGTTNEGIIAPKLSKERIAAIATPVEGTLVYATDDDTSKISAYTGTDSKVARIDKKGYYFYNGIEWVKTENIWEKQTNNDILLVDADIKNTVKYTEAGNFLNYPKEVRQISTGDATSGNVSSANLNLSTSTMSNSGNLNIVYADRISEVVSNGSKYHTHNFMLLDDKSNTSPISSYLGVQNTTHTAATSTRNFTSLYANVNVSEHRGTGFVQQIIGGYGAGYLRNGSASRVYGGLSEAAIYATTTTGTVKGGSNIVKLRGTGAVSIVYGSNNTVSFETSSSTATRVAGVHSTMVLGANFTGTVEDYSSFRSLNSIQAGTQGTVVNHYGLRLDNVNRGTTINRAIHTEAGEIRFGDLRHAVATNKAGSGDRVVYVTSNGVLKVGDASTALASRIWERDTVNNTIKLAVNSDGSDRANAITIDDNAQIYASSFKGKNGAEIFPDYVFQKYYDGVSDIKADYTFKSLSQVEDFVKTNGHLPGYKSAAEIKNQGYIDLMETQLTNVEKIEELYLHSIEQDKTNKTQAEELKAKDAKIQELEARLEKLEKLLK